ncbi:unnamed protein product, partial [Cladocopium goreaui]
ADADGPAPCIKGIVPLMRKAGQFVPYAGTPVRRPRPAKNPSVQPDVFGGTSPGYQMTRSGAVAEVDVIGQQAEDNGRRCRRCFALRLSFQE